MLLFAANKYFSRISKILCGCYSELFQSSCYWISISMFSYLELVIGYRTVFSASLTSKWERFGLVHVKIK